MKKDKIVMWECTWSDCGLVVPEGHEGIQRQKERCKTLNLPLMINCPECGSAMRRKVVKE